ncbi:MAG: efflux RND transporter periplasmic adaptor subunit [Xanthomonadaceae bacterium]|jgi:HlyD family secretion protein|nr:efflux RND transporter periplasmic adaptor subunit [Xanthomonadaceae bacterium]
MVRRIVIGVVVVGLIGGGVWYGMHRNSARTANSYRTSAVEQGNIRVAISSTGTLSAISTVTVGSQISGQVIEVLADYNDVVKKDQVIARIDPKTYEAQIEQGNAQIASARASLAQSQATLKNAELDYQRKAELGVQRLVAQSDVDLARAALDQARAQVNSAQAAIRQQTASTETTQVNLDRTVIRSPVDGVVLTRSIEPGQTVAASLQAPELFTIAEDLGKMKIELSVDESDIGQVKAGQNVTFTADAFPNRQFTGRVDQVRLAATTASNVVTYPVIVTVDNSDGVLLPGLTVNAEIEVDKRDNVLKIPNSALRYKPATTSTVTAPTPGSVRGSSGVIDDLVRVADQLRLDATQKGLFDVAIAEARERQSARQSQSGQSNGNRGGPGGPPPGPGGADVSSAEIQAQIRQRMADRFREGFAGFRNSLSDTQRKEWDLTLSDLVNAKRTEVYRLVDDRPQAVMVRLGASDGTMTEVSGGGLQAGDQIITGEQSKG